MSCSIGDNVTGNPGKSTWLAALTLILFLTFGGQGQALEKSVNPGDIYDAGIAIFHKEKYEDAIVAFSKIILSFPTSNLVSYSRFMIGQCYLKMEKYDEAVQQFDLYLKAYPDGDRVKGATAGIETAREKLREREREKPSRPVPGSEPSSEARRTKRRISAQVFYLEAKDLGEVEKRIQSLKEAGVNTLIFRAFQNRGDRVYKFADPKFEEGVYFRTEHAPVVDDLLGKVADIAHRNGIDLFAWMTTRYAAYGYDGHPEMHCKSYNFETKKIETARGFNLFRPDVLKRLEGLFHDLGRYPIDGILFQDDLVLRHNEDFSVEANRAFFKEFGYSPHPDLFYIEPYQSSSGKYYVKAYSDKFWVWAGWKNRWLMDVAKRLMAAAKTSNPGLEFGINLYYEAVLNHSNAAAWFSQTLEEAIKGGFDYYAVMAYHRQSMNELGMDQRRALDLMAEVTRKAVESVKDPSRVMIKVQLLDWKRHEVIPKKEMETLLKSILGQGEVSLAFVPYIEQFPLQPLKSNWTRK